LAISSEIEDTGSDRETDTGHVDIHDGDGPIDIHEDDGPEDDSPIDIHKDNSVSNGVENEVDYVSSSPTSAVKF
jgi:hypothetical protein